MQLKLFHLVNYYRTSNNINHLITMRNSYLLILIVLTTILLNVPGYVSKSLLINDDPNSDDQESSSTVIDSTPVEDNQAEQSTPQLTQPSPQSITTTTTVINQDDNNDETNQIDLRNVIKPKLIARSNNFDHKEDKNHRSYILSNIETYQLPSNDLLVRSRIVANIDWIIRRGGQSKQQLTPLTRLNDQENQVLSRRKRQADMMTTNQDQPMDQNGQPMKPGDPTKVNPVVERFRQIFGRMKEIIAEIRDSFNGNRVKTNMQGEPNGVNQQ